MRSRLKEKLWLGLKYSGSPALCPSLLRPKMVMKLREEMGEAAASLRKRKRDDGTLKLRLQCSDTDLSALDCTLFHLFILQRIPKPSKSRSMPLLF